jgi:hypothetical protein
MTENRNGFVVEAELRQVSGTVEREAAAAMIVRHSPGAQRITLGGDKGFDTADFVACGLNEPASGNGGGAAEAKAPV